MAPACEGMVVLFSRHEELCRGHRPSVFVREGRIVLTWHGEADVIALSEIPFVHGGVGFQVENALAAVGTCWGLGLPWDAIRVGLRTFRGDADECPGRFNVFPVGESTVIVDYAHNPSAAPKR